MPDQQPLISASQADTVVANLKLYYKLASSADNAGKQRIIQDEILKKIFIEFGANPTPDMAIYFCKILVVLSDHPQNARLLKELGYNELIGTICEQNIPPKLIDRFLRIQTRLLKAQDMVAAGDDNNLIRKQRRNKEFAFVLPALNEHQQAVISQCILHIAGCISVSFRSDLDKQKTRCIVRCKMSVEAKTVASEIMKVGFDGVDYLIKNEQGNEELFTFYPDENTAPVPAELPQYLDDKIDVFDPTRAVVTNDYKPQASGWFSSILSFW